MPSDTLRYEYNVFPIYGYMTTLLPFPFSCMEQILQNKKFTLKCQK